MSSSYNVMVLKPGYSRWIGYRRQEVDGIITLITGPQNILVDTGGPANRTLLPRLLRVHGLKPKDIDYVVCTHGHTDHVGNINLFDSATIMLSHEISEKDQFRGHDFDKAPYEIDEYVRVIGTPGHTQYDTSVIVKTLNGVYAIVGDLFEEEGDTEGRWKAISHMPDRQAESREEILALADVVIPGHGDAFVVDPRDRPRPPSPPAPQQPLRQKVFWLGLVPLLVAIAAGFVLLPFN